MNGSDAETLIDCEEGRRMGCASFCCRLIVRYDPEVVVLSGDGRTRKHCVDKDPDTGLCVHFDPVTSLCRIWETRPGDCRSFDCNRDERLQVVLREGYRSLTALVLSTTHVPVDDWRHVPAPTAAHGDTVDSDHGR